MSWLLELLVDAIREMCSQFIVDMMELITNMFTELLSCNLSLFEELFSVVGSLYKNVIVPTGIAILLMILVWQLFKSMFGGKAGVNAEEPIELICRSAISLFLLAGSKPLVDYILRIAGTPYQWVIGTKVKVASFSGYVSTLEGVTDTLGISSLSISVLMLIMQFVVAWNYFKMLMVIAERYVLLGVFSYTAPLAFATGAKRIAITAFELIAYNRRDCIAGVDAGHGNLYLAECKNGKIVKQSFVENGQSDCLDAEKIDFKPLASVGETLAKVAIRKANDKEFVSVFEPFYMRKSQAEREKDEV